MLFWDITAHFEGMNEGMGQDTSFSKNGLRELL